MKAPAPLPDKLRLALFALWSGVVTAGFFTFNIQTIVGKLLARWPGQ